MVTLLSDLSWTALQGAGYALLAILVRLHAAWRALAAVCAAAAARLAAAALPLRPFLAAAFALPPRDHIGSRPRPPTVLGVALAEELSEGSWAAAAEALGLLLAWAHAQGFRQALIYEPAGSLRQPHHLRQLELQLLQRRLIGAVRLQTGWQAHGVGATGTAAPGPEADGGLLTAVLLAAGDAQWPLMAVVGAAVLGSEATAGAAAAADVSAGSGSAGSTAAINTAIEAPARLRRRLQVVAGPLAGTEPDFVLVTGPALTLAGFPAWAVRSSEIYGVGPLVALDCNKLQDALQRFCTTKQRFGK